MTESAPEADIDTGIAEAFAQPEAARLRVRAFDKSSLGITEIRLDREGFGETAPIPYANAIMLALQLRAIPFHEAMTDNKPVPVHGIRRGDTLFYDMRRDPRANVMTRSHSLHFVLSRQLLDDVARETGTPSIEDVRPATGVAVHDAQLMRFGKRALAALRKPQDAGALFVSHLALALGIYTATRYGGAMPKKSGTAALSAAQVRLAKELISASLNGGLEIAELAAACGMGTRQFLVAFREATGMAPYQWLRLRRVDAARALAATGRHPLTEIAALCGFADASDLEAAIAGNCPLLGRDRHLN
jgi:AraC-like DNA-binding protein